MNSKNEWVGYADRSQEQIMDSVLPKLSTKLPRHTDHSPTEPLVQMLFVWSAIAGMLNYYIDKQGEEAFLVTATRYKNVVKFAKMVGYRIKGMIPASVELRFFVESPLPSDVLIPIGTEVQTADEIIYTTTDNLIILAGETEGFIDAVQQISFSNISVGTSDGTASQVFELIEEIVDGSVSVLVDGLGWTSKDSFLKSFQLDRDFVDGVGQSRKMEIVFGDGVKGEIPLVGADITVNYAVSQGSAGNVSENTITDIISSVAMPSGFILKVTNPDRASGGADVETLEDLQRKIPIFIRTQDNMVTGQDHNDVPLLAAGVGSAGHFFECGKYVDIYISPLGGGTATQTLLDNVADFLEPRRLITTKLTVRSAGVLQAKVKFVIQVRSNFVRADVVAAVRANLLNFLSSDVQVIRGKVKINDLVEVVETTEGVDSSDTIYFYVEPFARPLLENTTELLWNKSLLPASSETIKWVITFVSATSFRVSKDRVSLGTASVGTPITQNEIQFTILPSAEYAVGKKWEFYTYPYSKNLLLQEPSIVLAYTDDVLIDSEGGL
ncbi:baseplate J/gp47 family protein [Bernardetia sp.]|uniref:baseplate J/gp47 family protein n=1 Tax=Bernardetia sp. TaxID=1937974 RepID=UPI0025C1E513|nr:baseplate J/gp47 family protein [Bernardetia sp.]